MQIGSTVRFHRRMLTARTERTKVDRGICSSPNAWCRTHPATVPYAIPAPDARSPARRLATSEDRWLAGQGLRCRDRKRVVEGRSVSVSVDIGGRRVIKKKKKT